MESQTKTVEERREFPRYRCSEDKVAYVAIRPAFKKLGKLKDASMSGIGFKYALMDEQEEPLMSNESPVVVDLFVSDNGFYLPSVKCRLAYDKYKPNASPFDLQMRIREVGLKFDRDELSDEQRAKMELFLRHYTAGAA